MTNVRRTPVAPRTLVVPRAAVVLRTAIVLLAGVMHAGLVHAHDIEITAVAGADGLVRGQLYYSDGSPAVNERVNAYLDAQHTLSVYSGVTDAQGRFAFLPSAAGPLSLVAEALEGHRATTSIDVPERIAAPGLEAASVAADFAAIQEQLARLERRIRLSDIIGGVGFLVGLAGAGALLGRRGKR